MGGLRQLFGNSRLFVDNVFITIIMIVLLLLSVERCKFFDSKMKPLLLTYNNFDKGDEKLLKIIFKHGDGELVFAHYHNIMPPRCVIRTLWGNANVFSMWQAVSYCA